MASHSITTSSLDTQIKDEENIHKQYNYYNQYDENDVLNTDEIWDEPNVFWHSKQAAKILAHIPFTEILCSEARTMFLDFLVSTLEWTNLKNAPSWIKPGRRSRSASQISEWTHALGSFLGRVAGLLSLSDFQAKFLEPILTLEGDNCWSLLFPFVDTYICAYIYNAQVIPTDAIAILDLCLTWFLQDFAFKRNSYRSGDFSGFYKSKLVRTLMFVSVERTDMTARYVNDNWSEISHILPLVDRFVRVGGWATSVMDSFLTLCERAKSNYPAEAFADQVLSILCNEPEQLKGRHGTFILSHISELILHFAHRDTPPKLTIHQKFLRILDILVDMGDRRSAALQLSEVFREVCLPS